MTKEMTTQQYADLRKLYNASTVRKAIKFGHNLPGVTKVEKFGKQHKLHVSQSFIRKMKKDLEGN